MWQVVISEISVNNETAGNRSVWGALENFLELVVMHWNGRTYGNAYLPVITFKVGPLGTHTHLLIRSYHCWKHRWKTSFGTYRSLAVTFNLMSSMIAKTFYLFIHIFIFANREQPRDIRISLWVTFGWKWPSTSRGPISQPWRTSNQMWQPYSGRFHKKPSTGASNNGTIEWTSVGVPKGPTLKVIR